MNYSAFYGHSISIMIKAHSESIDRSAVINNTMPNRRTGRLTQVSDTNVSSSSSPLLLSVVTVVGVIRLSGKTAKGRVGAK